MVPVPQIDRLNSAVARYWWDWPRAKDARGRMELGPSQVNGVRTTYGKTSRLPALAEAARSRAFLWRRRAATIAVGALAVAMGYDVVFGHNGLTAFAHKREETRSLQQQMQQLQQENDRLQGHVDRLQSDPSAIEHEAREDLHYTRSGEVIYTLPAAPAAPPRKPSPAKP